MIKLHDCVCSTCAAVVNIPFTIISRTYGIDHIEQTYLSPETIDLLAPNQSIADSNKILSMIFYCEDAEFKPIFCTFSLVGALYGAIHCFAWNSSFPTISEQLYWRSASSTLVVSCVAALRSVFPWDNPASTGFWITICWFFTHTIGGSLVLLATFSYPLARITLLVLAIASLRSLPPSAFHSVDWIDFIPHI